MFYHTRVLLSTCNDLNSGQNLIFLMNLPDVQRFNFFDCQTFFLSYHEILYVKSEATLSLVEKDSLAEALKN